MSVVRNIASRQTVSVEYMSFQDFSSYPEFWKQRDHESRATKPHLKDFIESHLVVAVIELPDGTRYKVDGHSRCEAATQGQATHLLAMTLVVLVYQVASPESAERIFDSYDNPSAQKTSSDRIFGELNRKQMIGNSVWGRKAAFGSGLDMAVQAWAAVEGISLKSVKPKQAQVDSFEDEIRIMDEWDIKSKRFPIGILAAAFLSVKKHGEKASEFWMQFNETPGVIKNEAKDSVAMLHQYIKEQRLMGNMGGIKANQNHMQQALALYLRNHKTPGKLFERLPTPIAARKFLEI